jgi:membrane protein implicated in regulation of membrane protease activity
MAVLLIVIVAAALIIWGLSFAQNTGQPEARMHGDLGLVGATGEAQETFSSEGKVLVRGELWKASAPHGIIQRGTKVRITGYKGALTLIVEPAE